MALPSALWNTSKWWQSQNACSLGAFYIHAATNTNSPPSAEWMMTTLLKGPSPLLLYTPTFTSNGVRGGKVSSLYLYVVESAEVTIFSFQPLVPLARNATIYPKPSPFWNSSDTGWKHQKERNNHPGGSFTDEAQTGLPALQLCDWWCVICTASLSQQGSHCFSSMVAPYNQLSIYQPFSVSVWQC